MEKKKFDTCVQEADSELALNNCQAQSTHPKGCIYILLSAFSNTLSLKVHYILLEVRSLLHKLYTK